MPRLPVILTTLTILLGATSLASADSIGSVYSSTADKDCRKVSSLKLDGDDYYLTTSSFDAAPALLLQHSRDLVSWTPLTFALPPLPGGQHYYRVVDTALASPDDYCEPHSAPLVDASAYPAQARSAVILVAR